MGRVRRISVVLTLLTLLGSAPVRAQSSAGEGTADTGATPDENGWFDETEPQQVPAQPSPNASSAPSTAPARPAPPPEDADPRALTDFRPTLDPYGVWIEDPNYGTVWVPHRSVVGDGFSPYVSGGHWALSTSNEWVWVSDYPFGSVVYHYGRWVWIPGTGWAWIPGYQYAPAWVSWRVPTGPYAYVGWAPLPPDYIWVGGVAVGFYGAASYYWAFCPSVYVFHPHVTHYVVRDRAVVTRAAYYSRPYTAPSPRYRVPASPSPRAARVPSNAIPRERIAARPTTRSVPNVNGQRNYAAAGSVRRPAATSVDRRAVSPAPSAGAREVRPATRAPNADRTAVAPRAVSPERSATPAPNTKRSTVSPMRRALTPGNVDRRTVSPVPRAVTPAPRAVRPAPSLNQRAISPGAAGVSRSSPAPRVNRPAVQAAPRVNRPAVQAAPSRSFGSRPSISGAPHRSGPAPAVRGSPRR